MTSGQMNVRFPKEWLEGRHWIVLETVQMMREQKTGRVVWIGGGVLDDGTNLLAMAWTGGRSVTRIQEFTGWAIEERPDPRMDKPLRAMWKSVVQSQVKSLRDARARERLLAAETNEEKIRSVAEDRYALQIAYEKWCETEKAPDMTLDEFRAAARLLGGSSGDDDLLALERFAKRTGKGGER